MQGLTIAAITAAKKCSLHCRTMTKSLNYEM